MSIKYVQILASCFLCMVFLNQALAQENQLPQNYMMEKYGVSKPFYCDLEDPIEEIACVSWDSALGAIHRLKKKSFKGFKNFTYSNFQVLFAINSANLIQQLISSPNTFLYEQIMDIKKNINQNDLCVIRNHGRCGNHQFIFDRVMGFGEIPSRFIGIYMKNESKRFNHAANEVLIDGKWMFLDSTNGTVWRNDDDPFILFSFNTILNLENEKQFRYKNENDIWNMTNTFLVQRGVRNINQYNYIFDETSFIGVTFDEEGLISFSLQDKLGFQGIPNYIGSNTGKNTGISMNWSVPNYEENLDINLKVDGFGGCSSYGPVILDDAGNEYLLLKGNNKIRIKNGATFNVKRQPDEVCYIVFAGITETVNKKLNSGY